MDEKPAQRHPEPARRTEPAQRTHREAEPRRRRRTHRVIVGVGSLGVLAGMVLLVVDGGVLAFILGAALLGLAGIAFVSLAFLIVGEGEEDDRVRHPHG
jgi:uncharacterized membrane protein